MANRTRSNGLAALVVVLAAVAFCAAMVAGWADQSVTRTVGDATVQQIRRTSGLQLVPLGIVTGLATLLCGVGLLVTGRGALPVVVLLTISAGASALGATALGIARALALEGRVTAAPWLAAAASVAVLAGGVAAFGRPRRQLSPRYDLDVPSADAEWRLASEPSDEEGSPDDPAGYPEARS